MTRNWRWISTATLVAALLAIGPAFGDDPVPDKAQDPAKELKDLKKKVDDLERDMKEVKKWKTDIDDLNIKLDALKDVPKALANLDKKIDQSSQRAQNDTTNLTQEIGRIQDDVKNLRQSSTSATRQSAFAPGASTAPQATGRVELINTWTMPVTVVVNHKAYPLAPMTSPVFTDPLPAGTFNFEVLGVTGPNNVRTLAPGETYRIHVHPQT
jgi:hypothetical protein